MDNAHTATIKKNNEAKDAKDRSHIQRLDLENNNNNNNGGTRRTTSSPNSYNEKQEKPIGASHGKADDSDEISVAGRTKMPIPKPKEDQVRLSEKEPEAVDKPVESKSDVATEHKHETSKEEEEEREASAELDSILKRSPIIVFSKSYCPFSRKAKSILNQYNIVPALYIVELDKHALGPQLQKLLGKITGRRTVPNVLVNGISIGGGDDVEALDRDDELISKIKSIAGKSIMEIERLPAAEESHAPLTINARLSDAQPRKFAPPSKSGFTDLVCETLQFVIVFVDDPRPTLLSLNHDNLTINIRSRIVTVEGPRGKLTKDLSHISVSFGRPDKNTISIELHHGARKGIATLRTVRTLINNLIIGVTRGFLYKMRYVYAHFPINVNIEKNGETGNYEVEIRNFLGEKIVRRITAQAGVEVITSPNVKDELQLSGNSLEAVSQSAADIQQICRVRNKDIRKFLDGLYVSERTNIVVE
uniref:60S ribosomal protein L9-B n=1 Tax=Talaromyces marneffei PM1 TaxID=1077442 RepID=A0A093V431_TALMA